MEKIYIKKLLTQFFTNDYPTEVRKKFGDWFIRPVNEQEKEETMEEIWESLPVVTDITSFEELKKINKKIHSANRVLYRWVAAVAAIILLPLSGVITTHLYYKQAPEFQEVKMVECFVPNGERKEIVLPDGSTVWLNSGTILIYPEKFGDIRTLYLSGEGNFTVIKNEEVPFIVKTNYLDVEALGTVFNVHAYPDDYKTTTILESGKVKVNEKTGFTDFILSPNEQLVYNHADGSFEQSYIDASRLNSWTEGYFVFSKAPLQDIFHSLEKRYDVKIMYNNERLTKQTFNVRFHDYETLEEAFNILKKLGAKFNYQIEENEVYIR